MVFNARKNSSGLWGLTLLFLMGLTAVAHAETVTLVDQVGREVTVPDRPLRIIALAPSITEIIYDLGAEDRLVGVTQYSDYPVQAVELPRVGSYVRLDLEKIVALKPDLCLAIKEGNPRHVIDKIAEIGIPVYAIDPRNIDQVIDSIIRIGNLLNEGQAAARLVDSMHARIARVQSLVAKTSLRPRVFFQIDAEPMVSAGSNTFIQELIELAGGVNAAAGPDPYPRYSWEDILVLQPDIVLISSMAGGRKPDELRRSWEKWHQLTAVARGRIFIVDANLFDRPTPRLIDGLEVIAPIIHPEIFGAVP